MIHPSKRILRMVRGSDTNTTQAFTCGPVQVPVTFTMPRDAKISLIQQIARGDAGIEQVTESLSHVDSATADAWNPKDKERVKEAIRTSVGFQQVNRHVKTAMVQWIGSSVKDHFQTCLDAAENSISAISCEVISTALWAHDDLIVHSSWASPLKLWSDVARAMGKVKMWSRLYGTSWCYQHYLL